MKPRHGLLLFAHGARDVSWARPFQAVASMLADDAERPVALAYLELMQPDLATAGAELVALGCEAITVVPLFLGTGGHVKRDLPKLLDELRARHAGTRWRLAPAIGEAPLVIAAMAEVAREAAAASDNTA
ncbi:MAG TPA: CbiX/SirB N-terminal domain-containing protein [Methylibium sp.]|uniref:sirohydrochlorin chelatase n=1 Tax=Methylibium sp. TaxID=2067992 RepID=UPI002DBA6BEC|nr:CbiX/SirB N-terminal domain-containing protein [Methylibium sp.]HEU4460165.1 CbiX/SirB N-terminal domain-containing protein [Methylibium sp.]